MITYLRVIAVFVVLGLAWWFGFEMGVGHEHTARLEADNARQATQIVATVRRDEHNTQIANEHAAINTIVKRSYTDEIAAITAPAVHLDRLRIPAAVCGGTASGRAQTASASRSDAAPAGTGALQPGVAQDPVGEGIALPDDIAGRLDELTHQADMAVASCRALQKFTTDNGLAP